MFLHEIEASLKGRKLEEYSLSRLIGCKECARIIVTDLERSAKEIKNYIFAKEPFFGDAACTEVLNLKNEMVSLIDAQAEVYEDFYQRVDKEIAKRLETTDK